MSAPRVLLVVLLAFLLVLIRPAEVQLPASDTVAVPEGVFFMGCHYEVDKQCGANELPWPEMYAGAFEIDRLEVTVAQYRRCAGVGACSVAGVNMPYFRGEEQGQTAKYCNWGKPGRDAFPMNCVDWSQATAYCAWMGMRLPTEPEWEKAARGTAGNRYPWGNTSYGEVGLGVANICDERCKQEFPDAKWAAGYDDEFVDTAPVGSYPAGASPYGALDMVGNVWEWTSSEFVGGRAVRGGSWSFAPWNGRASARLKGTPTDRDANLGFRCARDLVPPPPNGDRSR
jgi:formylglycine-generating enzyme required for sulfatase activity